MEIRMEVSQEANTQISIWSCSTTPEEVPHSLYMNEKQK